MVKPISLPPPEALDSEPRMTPDGSIDWHWFYQQVAVLEAWYRVNICIRCGKRERANGMAVCDTRECEGIGISDRTGRCAFCGSSRKLNSSWGGPTMPLFLERCDDCRDRKVPDRDGALGQARMF